MASRGRAGQCGAVGAGTLTHGSTRVRRRSRDRHEGRGRGQAKLLDAEYTPGNLIFADPRNKGFVGFRTLFARREAHDFIEMRAHNT